MMRERPKKLHARNDKVRDIKLDLKAPEYTATAPSSFSTIRMSLVSTSKSFNAGALKGFTKHMSINDTRSVRIISIMAKPFFSSTS